MITVYCDGFGCQINERLWVDDEGEFKPLSGNAKIRSWRIVFNHRQDFEQPLHFCSKQCENSIIKRIG